MKIISINNYSNLNYNQKYKNKIINNNNKKNLFKIKV